MSITPEENAAMWERFVNIAREGVAPTATAMAKNIADRAAKVTLRRTRHSPGAWHRARPGEPPALASGNLARSMFYVPAHRGGGLRAFAYVGNSAEYSRILEFGCVVTKLNKRKLHWRDSGSPVKGWFHDALEIPPHPYLRPTTEEAVADGSLRDAARDEFRKYDP